MKLIDKKEGVYSIFCIEKNVLYGKIKEIYNYADGNKIDISAIGNVRRSENVLAYIHDSTIDFFNSQLVKISSFKSEKINNESGLDVISSTDFVIHNFIESDTLSIVINSKVEKDISDFWGKILSDRFIIHYKEKTFKNSKSFRLTNLLNTETYFEFQCDEGYQLANQFYTWKNTLIFMYSNNSELTLVQKNIKTGDTIWNANIEYPDLVFDSKQGIMVSIWGNGETSADSKDYYQIIDLNAKSVDLGNPISGRNFSRVEISSGYFLNSNKLYFSDNPFSYSGREPNAPLLGCFDIETKKIDFMQEIPEMAGSSIANIICDDEKIYVRSGNGDLIVFEI